MDGGAAVCRSCMPVLPFVTVSQSVPRRSGGTRSVNNPSADPVPPNRLLRCSAQIPCGSAAIDIHVGPHGFRPTERPRHRVAPHRIKITLAIEDDFRPIDGL